MQTSSFGIVPYIRKKVPSLERLPTLKVAASPVRKERRLGTGYGGRVPEPPPPPSSERRRRSVHRGTPSRETSQSASHKVRTGKCLRLPTTRGTKSAPRERHPGEPRQERGPGLVGGNLSGNQGCLGHAGPQPCLGAMLQSANYAPFTIWFPFSDAQSEGPAARKHWRPRAMPEPRNVQGDGRAGASPGRLHFARFTAADRSEQSLSGQSARRIEGATGPRWERAIP